MKLSSKRLTIVAIFAALYAVGVIALAPISFGPAQVRVADAMLPLSMIFGLPGALGFGLGCLIANAYGMVANPYSGLGIVDIVGGATANIVACTLAWYIGRKRGVAFRFLGTVVQTVTVSLIVSGYLALASTIPFEIWIIGLLVGSIVAINVLGFPIEEAIRKSKIFRVAAADKKTENKP